MATEIAKGTDAAEGARLWAEIASAALEPARAVRVTAPVTLAAGLAEMDLASGVLIPATAAGGRTLEWVFVGEGRIELEPPDAVEGTQLELFTGGPRLDETLSAAVLVPGPEDAALAALLRQPPSAPAPDQLATARSLFALWKQRERVLLGVEGHLLGRAAGDPALEGYFAALCRSATLDVFFYLYDPRTLEPAQLGRFVPAAPVSRFDVSDQETRRQRTRLLRQIAQTQHRGRLAGFDVDDHGTFDTWVSAAPRDSQGRPSPGIAAFEPLHYDLDVTLAGRDLRLAGRARIELRPTVEGARVVRLRLDPNLDVRRVTLAATGADSAVPASPADRAELFFHRDGVDRAERGTDAARRGDRGNRRDGGAAGLTVLLPRAAEPGQAITLEIEYAGGVIEMESGGRHTLPTAADWYPHAGEIDRATYRATFHWPVELSLVASGRRLDGGTAPDGSRWEQRGLDAAAGAFTFEVGKFQTHLVQAGHVRITMAYDSSRYRVPNDRRSATEQGVAGSLAFYEELFGPYPLDELTVVTTPHEFTAPTLGLVALSDFALRDYAPEVKRLGLADRRAVVAHEVAHQWWGGAVEGASYRDQWLGEALATYAAMLYARPTLADADPIVVMTPAWRQQVTARMADGRRIEDAGPLVAGSRLLTSQASDAYMTLMQDKAPVVLATLGGVAGLAGGAAEDGSDAFVRQLRRIYRSSLHRTLSTEQLLTAVSAATSPAVTALAGRLVYGTELPSVFYTYRFAADPAGGARVIGTLRQEVPLPYRYRVERAGTGADAGAGAGADAGSSGSRSGATFDVARTSLVPGDAPVPDLVVPADIAFYDPRLPAVGKKGDANSLAYGHLLLQGESGDFSVHVGGEPKALTLDPRGEVFARFTDENSLPRSALLRSARLAFSQGRLAAAEALYDRALATAEKDELAADEAWRDIRFDRRRLTAEIHLGRARLFLEQGRNDEAARALDQADVPHGADAAQAERDVLLAWLDVRRGHFDRAYRRLDKENLDSSEGILLLAIAARATGRRDAFDAALRTARQKGADASLLAASPPSAP